MSPGHGHGHGHGHGRRRGWRGLPPPTWGYGPNYWYGYDYWPSDVYSVAEVYTIEAYNAGRAEVLGQGVSWSAAMIAAQVYMQSNPPFLLAGAPESYVRIVPGYAGASVCEWRGSPGGWVQTFCNPGYAGGAYYGVGSDPETPTPGKKGAYIALAVVGGLSAAALAWMYFGARKGSRYGFAG